MSKAMGFGCHRRGHKPSPGFDHPPQANGEGRFFIPRVCSECRCMYVEWVLGVVASNIVDSTGKGMLKEKEEE